MSNFAERLAIMKDTSETYAELKVAKSRIDKLEAAITKTLDENGH